MTFEMKLNMMREEGLEEGKNSTLFKLVSKNLLDMETASVEAGIPLDEFISKMQSAGYEIPEYM